MSRKRPSFPEEWWNELGDFLEDNPELGFNENQQREFMMWLVNRFKENDQIIIPEHKFEDLVDDLNLD